MYFLELIASVFGRTYFSALVVSPHTFLLHPFLPMKTLVLSVLALLVLGCQKNDPEASLPAATQVGANTGGCLIDGKPFVPTGWGGGLLSNPTPALFGGFSFDSLYSLQLNGSFNGDNTTVRLFFRSQRPGIYLLNKNTAYYPQGGARYVLNHATYSQSSNQNEVYVTDAQHTGQVTLAYGTVASGISAGTFEFTAASQVDPTKTVTVTSGRFDRKQ